MRNIVFVMAMFAAGVHAETVFTPTGMYVVSTAGSTTYVTPVGRSSNSTSSVPVAITAPNSGVSTYVTPSGTYQVSRSGSTTHVIQTSRSGK